MLIIEYLFCLSKNRVYSQISCISLASYVTFSYNGALCLNSVYIACLAAILKKRTSTLFLGESSKGRKRVFVEDDEEDDDDQVSDSSTKLSFNS